MTRLLTTLMEELFDGSLLGVEHKSGHVIVVACVVTKVTSGLIPETEITLECRMGIEN